MNAALVAARLPELLEGFAAAIPDLLVNGVDMDSRRIAPGALFLATRGVSGHGLSHAAAALRNGAAAIAWEPSPGLDAAGFGVPTVAVERLSAHAGEIAARFWNHPSRGLFAVGVTGTDGKTSTAHLVAQALDRLERPCAYFGTIGYGRLGSLEAASHTTPDAVRLQQLLAEQRDFRGARAVAMEVSSHALDQRRIGGIEFDVGILTNVGRDHLDYHGDLDAYAAAKRRLFEVPGLKAAVLNGDDARGGEWAAIFAEKPGVTIYGLDCTPRPGCRNVLGRSLRLHADGMSMDIQSSWGAARLESRLLGRFNAYNLLAALSALLHSGAALADCIRALSLSTTVPGRIEGFRGPSPSPLVVVDYAHTPQALANVIDALRTHCSGRLVCVFGCGGDRDRGKRPLMGAAATRADALIVTDDNPRSESPESITDEILAGIPQDARGRVRVEHDRASAIAEAVRNAQADDVVLVAGKGHEDYQIYGDVRRDFSDRDFIAGLLGVEVRA